jgi:hypothetical protein
VSFGTLESLFRAIWLLSNKEQPIAPPLASSWATLDDEERRYILRSLRTDGENANAERGIAVLARLYPGYPLAFIAGTSGEVDVRSKDVTAFKRRLVRFSNRFSKDAIRVHAHVLMAECKIGMMIIPPSLGPPSLGILYDESADEESDAYKHAAGFVRSSLMAAFAARSEALPLKAAEYFWNRGLEIENCAPYSPSDAKASAKETAQ